eukprot:6490343-Amphidinium_carterae.1
MVDQLVAKFKPSVIFFAPECSVWSVQGSRASQSERLEAREGQMPLLQWMCDLFCRQTSEGRHAIIENPQSSFMWKSSPLADLQRRASVQSFVVHQCQFGAKHPENNKPIKKATTLLSSLSLRKITKPCCGHLGGHGMLQGMHPEHHVPNTALAMVYPKNFCKKLVECVLNQHSGHILWTCIRCRLGRHTTAPHNRIPGECAVSTRIPQRSHGRWWDPQDPTASGVTTPEQTRDEELLRAQRAARPTETMTAPPELRPLTLPPGLPASSSTQPALLVEEDGDIGPPTEIATVPPEEDAPDVVPVPLLADESVPEMSAPAPHQTNELDEIEVPVDLDGDWGLEQDVIPRYDLKHVAENLRKLWKDVDDPESMKEFVRQVLGTHVRFWHAPAARLVKLFKELGLPKGPLSAIAAVIKQCPRCRNAMRPMSRPSTKSWLPSCFNQYLQADSFHLFDREWILLVDELFRYKQAYPLNLMIEGPFHRVPVPSATRWLDQVLWDASAHHM